MDYLVAVGAAIIGIAIMSFIFRSISSADITTTRYVSERKSRSKRSRRPSRRYKEDVLDLESEALIARELAHRASGMNTDTKIVQPSTLDEMCQKRHAKEDSKKQSAALRKQNDRHLVIDQELGFQHVGVSQHSAKPKKLVEAAQSDDDIEAKLNALFRNNSRKNKNVAKVVPDQDKPVAGPSGGRVTLQRDFTNARSWYSAPTTSAE